MKKKDWKKFKKWKEKKKGTQTNHSGALNSRANCLISEIYSGHYPNTPREKIKTISILNKFPIIEYNRMFFLVMKIL